MSIHEDKDTRFKRLDLKVGLFILVALAGMVVAAILVGVERDFFGDKAVVSFTAPGADGIVEGMPVKLSGFRIGRVKSLELTESASVRVALLINAKYMARLGAGSKARVAKEGFIGSSHVELTPPPPGSPRLEDGDSLEYEKRRGVDEAVTEIRPVMEELKTFLRYVNDPDGDVRKTMAGVREFSAGLSDLRMSVKAAAAEATDAMKEARSSTRRLAADGGEAIASARRLIDDVDAVARRMEPAVERMEKASARIAETADRLPELTGKLDGIMDDVKLLTGTLAAEGPVLRGIITDASEGASDARKIARGVRTSWPVRLTLPEPRRPELVPLDGYPVRGGRDERR